MMIIHIKHHIVLVYGTDMLKQLNPNFNKQYLDLQLMKLMFFLIKIKLVIEH